MNNYKLNWDLELPTELKFWEGLFIKDKTSNQVFVKNFHDRIQNEPRCIFEDYVEAKCKSEFNILDVGAGPLSQLGRITNKPTKFNITAIDPLADKYDMMWKESGITPRIRTIKGLAEEIDQIFEANKFDFAYSRNAIDHSFDPISSIKKMVKVTKRMIILCGHSNTGLQNKYNGLHQWNFECSAEDDLTIWNKEKRFSLKDELKEKVEIKVKGDEWYHCELHTL